MYQLGRSSAFTGIVTLALLGLPGPAAANDATTCLNGSPDVAIAACNRAINRGIGDRSANYNNRGIAYRKNGDTDRAIDDYSEAIRIKPRNSIAYRNRGLAYRAKNDNDRAIDDYNEAIRIDPKYGPAFHDRGHAYYAKADYDRAIADYSQVMRIDRKNTQAIVNRGNAYRIKGDYDRALADYNEAIRVDPKFAQGYNGRGNVYSRKGDSDRAMAEYSEAIRLDPKFAVAYDNRGNIYYGKGDYDRAIAEYSEAIRVDPKYAAAWLNRGNSYRRKGDNDRAIADLDEAIRIAPKYTTAHASRAYTYYIKNDNDRALAGYNEAIRIDPKFAPAYNGRGIVYSRKGDNDRAFAEYNEAIRLDPNLAVAYGNRGNAYRTKGDNDRAIADYSECIRLDPKYSRAYTDRGIIYQKTGDVAKAQADFIAALGLPKDPVNTWPQETAKTRLADLSRSTTPSTTATPSRPKGSTAGPSGVVASTKEADSKALTTTSQRIALVIGNSAYDNVPELANPERDARLVADTLKRTGFQNVTLLSNLKKDALVGALRNFAVQAETAEWAVVYYAGHGMEVGGTNYLIPVDARVAADRDISFEAVPLDQVLNAADRARKLRLVILDACRDNPFRAKMKRTMTVASRSVTAGLAPVEPEAGTLVVFAAKDGQQALDGDGKNSPFAQAFVSNVETPGLEVRRLFDYVRDDVLEMTNRQQQPFSYGSISGRQDFYFVAAK